MSSSKSSTWVILFLGWFEIGLFWSKQILIVMLDSNVMFNQMFVSRYSFWFWAKTLDIKLKRPMNYLSIGGKSVIKNDQSKLTRWDVIIYDMEVPGKPFEECCAKLIHILYTKPKKSCNIKSYFQILLWWLIFHDNFNENAEK